MFIHLHSQFHPRNVVSEGSNTTPGPAAATAWEMPLLQTNQQPFGEETQTTLALGYIPQSKIQQQRQ